MPIMLRILLVKTSSMGDVIHNLPIINDILTNYPDTQFDWLVEESFAEIPKLHPKVGEIIPVAIRRWRKHLFNRATWHEISALKQRLRETRYDAVIDTQGLIKSAMLAKLAKGKLHGMDWQSAREPLASLFYQYQHHVPRHQHAIVRNRMLAALALNYPIPAGSPDYGLDKPLASTLPFELPKAYAVFLHGTSRDSKLWPISHWIALAHKLKLADLQILLPWSNANEEKRAKEIAAQSDNVTVLPKLSLTMIAEILSGSTINIGVDTGLMHLSTALNKPSMAIFTDTDPALTGVVPGNADLAVNIGGKAKTPDAEHVFKLALTYISKGHK